METQKTLSPTQDESKAEMTNKTLDLAAELIAEMKLPLDVAERMFRARLIRRVLTVAKGNQCRAARRLNIHRNTLGRHIREVDTEAPANKKRPKSSVAAYRQRVGIDEHGEFVA